MRHQGYSPHLISSPLIGQNFDLPVSNYFPNNTLACVDERELIGSGMNISTPKESELS